MLCAYAVFLMLYQEGADSINDRIGADNGTPAWFLTHEESAAARSSVL
jgi:hypothetical protein